VGGPRGRLRRRSHCSQPSTAATGTNADTTGVKSRAARIPMAVMPETAAVKAILALVPQSGACVLWAACAAARRTAPAQQPPPRGGLELHVRSTSTKLVVSSTPLPVLDHSLARVAGVSAVASCSDESAIGLHRLLLELHVPSAAVGSVGASVVAGCAGAAPASALSLVCAAS
jgi:hypothetical protein